MDNLNNNEKLHFSKLYCKCSKCQIKHIVKSDKKIIINKTPSSAK